LIVDDNARDPDYEWLDYVPPQGVVAAQSVLRDLGLVPERQTALETGEVAALLDEPFDAWAFVERILGWDARFVAGAPGGPDLPADLVVVLPEQNDQLVPSWAVKELGDGGVWQMLVRVEAVGIAPDTRHSVAGWEATPHQRLERLLREKGIPVGLLITQTEARTGELEPELRLVYAPRGETSGWQIFPLRPMATVAGRPILGGLKLLLDRNRLFTAGTERRLPALLHASRLAQDTVSEKLSGQVLGALFELLRGFDAAEPDLVRRLAAEQPGHLYEGLLATLMRLVFVLYAEDRDLLPSRRDDEARRIYDAGYSVRSLHARLTEDAALNPDTMDERRGGWGQLVALFRLIHAGHPSGFVQARRGGLFDPDRYPFLEGRAEASDAPSVLKLPDGSLLRILDGLLILKERGRPPERLSYRTLDVEQIGSVYETVMGFEARLAAGRSLAVKGAKGLPFFVDLDALAAEKGKERIKLLKTETGLSLSGAKAVGVEAAANVESLAEALASSVDGRGSPTAAPFAAGTPILQPTDERRRSGSHYTPRSLTGPIVEHALAPAFERLGRDATPEQILELKVCDPAMGSGAFLVEACRAIGARLTKSWERWPETKPVIPADEVDDETLHARRLVAQRCLYGVDRNPRAVELGKLSLWLATLARDHEFTFLDHALKCGDSLVGLDLEQISAVHWDRSKAPTFVGKLVRDHLAEGEAERARVRAHAEDATEAELRPLLRRAEAKLEVARRVGDGVIAAFFAEDKPKARIAKLVDFQKDILAAGDWATRAKAFGEILREGERPIPAFHWPVEFPEVFSRSNPGFDVIVANPPYLGGTKISGAISPIYFQWISHHIINGADKADLIAYFLRRTFVLLRSGGSSGILATSSIAEGDTRIASLAWIRRNGGQIFRARKRMPWPGEASVVVAQIHISKSVHISPVILDEKTASEINSFLTEGSVDDDPSPLAANLSLCFEGFVPYGDGFVFDSKLDDPLANILQREPNTAEVIFPYLGGEDVTEDPGRRPSRFVVYLGQMDEITARNKYPGVMDLLESTVRPYRQTKSSRVSGAPWWQFLWSRPGLFKKMSKIDRMMVMSRVGKHHALAFVASNQIPSTRLSVIADPGYGMFGQFQSRVHEIWARKFGGMVGETPIYNPKKCFLTFPLINSDTKQVAEAARVYHEYRDVLMDARQEGLTKTYNRFHLRSETATDIVRLRELHSEMDKAVLEAYGWHDLAERASPEFLDESDEDNQNYQGRLSWRSELREEVLTRLLGLNAERGAEECVSGSSIVSRDDADDAASDEG
jgi:hypothetical protein